MTEYRQEYAVTLAFSEVYLASLVGVRRQLTRVWEKKRDAHGMRGGANDWNWHINGACAECAFAKEFDLFWPDPFGDIRKGDVGRIEVKCTDKPDNRIWAFKDSPDASPFVLAIGRKAQWRLVGWMCGHQIKSNEEWYQDPTGDNRYAYYPPRRLLRPMGELKLIMATERLECLTSSQSSNIISGRFGQGSSPPSQG